MPRDASALDLPLTDRPAGRTLAQWLYEALRTAILDGRLGRGARLPATRDLARQYGVARGTVVTVFEQLQSEGYVTSRVGSGTRVSDQIPEDLWQPAPARAAVRQPPPASRFPPPTPLRPFHPFEPALDQFPMELWTRIAARRLRRATRALLGRGDVRGYAPLREAIAAYLGSSRGVRCIADQVVIVSGAQQALDLLARVLVRPGEPVWIEDPAYPGATAAFRNAGARLVPVPVDEHGLDVARGVRRAARAKAVYLTPAHQFPLGASLSIERRLAVLDWARRSGARVVEDDYDSEYRFAGRPIPALQGLDRSDCVVFLGSFSKVLFPSLRLGYLVVPPALLEPLLRLRVSTAPTLDQAILCDFITEGHLGRHIRRMRELYRTRLAALREASTAHLTGLLEIPSVEAGLNTATRVVCGLSARQAEAAAAAAGVEAMALDRYALERRDVHGLLLGFAAFDPSQIRAGVLRLADALTAAQDRRRRATAADVRRLKPPEARQRYDAGSDDSTGSVASPAFRLTSPPNAVPGSHERAASGPRLDGSQRGPP
jgi:GntR family transcriptional regulator/MocR family aminotransferase